MAWSLRFPTSAACPQSYQMKAVVIEDGRYDDGALVENPEFMRSPTTGTSGSERADPIGLRPRARWSGRSATSGNFFYGRTFSRTTISTPGPFLSPRNAGPSIASSVNDCPRALGDSPVSPPRPASGSLLTRHDVLAGHPRRATSPHDRAAARSRRERGSEGGSSPLPVRPPSQSCTRPDRRARRS